VDAGTITGADMETSGASVVDAGTITGADMETSGASVVDAGTITGVDVPESGFDVSPAEASIEPLFSYALESRIVRKDSGSSVPGLVG
jgi:hypothetical protein